MIINLTPEERETIIVFNDYDDVAEIYTAMRTMKTKLEKLAEENPKQYKKVKENDISVTYTFPKQFITLRAKKRIVSQEQKQAASERLAKARRSAH